MRVAVAAGDSLKAHPGGVARYTIELARALATLPGDASIEAWVPYRRLLRGYLAGRLGLPVRWHGQRPPRHLPDIFHATSTVYPAWKSPLEVATAHDFYALQTGHGRSAEEVARRMAYITRSDWVICVSETTRAHMHQIVDFPRQRSCAIPLSVSASFRPASPEQQQALRQRHNLPSEYLLFVGKARKNKNLDGLLKAYAHSGMDMPLLIAGQQPKELHQQYSELVDRQKLASRVRFLGFVDDAALPVLMSAASGFCFPSLFEGFGLPVLEAMACGVPVLTSRGIATEEASGGHGVLVDPHSVEDMARGLCELPQLDATRRQQAAEYAQGFSWQSMAQQTLGVYRQLQAAGPREASA